MKGCAYISKILTDIINEHFENANPPESEETLKKNIILAKIAQCAKNILFTAEDEPLGIEQAKLVDLSYRIILKEYTEILESSKNSSAALQNAPAELQRIKGQLQKLEEENTNLKAENADLKEKAEAMEGELAETSDERERVLQLKAMLTSKVRDEISQKNTEISKLQDKIITMENELAIIQGKYDRANSQLQQLHDDNATLNQENIKINEKLNKKASLIAELQSSMERQAAVIAELQKKQEEIQTQTKKVDAEETRRIAIAKVLSANEDLNNELIEMKTERDNAVLLLQKQSALLNYYEKATHDQFEKQENYNTTIKELKNELDECKETIEDLEEDKEELEQIREIVLQTIQVLQPTYLITPEQLPETIAKIMQEELTKKDDSIDDIKNRGLSDENDPGQVPIVDGLTRFILKFLKEGEINTSFLTENVAPIIEDKTLKLDALNAVEAIREEWIEFNDAKESQDLLTSLLSKQTFEIDNQEELASSYIMCAIAERLSTTIKEVVSELKHLKKAIPLICSDKELPSSIARYTINLKEAIDSFAPKIVKTMNLETVSTESIELVENYIEESTKLIANLDSMIKQEIKFTGKITDIPDAMLSYVKDIEKVCQQKVEEMQNNFENKQKLNENKQKELNDKIEEMRATIRKKSFDLCVTQTELSRGKQQIKSLQESLEETTARVEDLTEENQELEQNLKNVTESLARLQADYKRLETSSKERQEAAEKRTSALLESERMARIEEVENMRKKNKADNDVLAKEMGKKIEKISLLKTQIAKIKEDNQQAQGQYKTKIVELTQENDTLKRLAEEIEAESKAKIGEMVEKYHAAVKKNKELANAAKKRSSALSNAFIASVQTQTEETAIKEVAASDTEWQPWAQNLVSMRITGRQRKLPNEELRKKISDVVYNLSSQTKLISIIENLRTQKQLTEAAASVEQSSTFSMKSLTLAALIITSLHKNASTPRKRSILSKPISAKASASNSPQKKL